MTGLISYKTLQEQYMQKSLLEQEADYEVKNLYVLQLNYYDTCESFGRDKHKAGGLHTRIVNWLDGLNNDERRDLMLFLHCQEAVRRFVEDYSDKLKGKVLADWHRELEEPGRLADIENMMKVVIYEYKADLAKRRQLGFFSPEAHREACLWTMLKTNRNGIHEAVRAAMKISQFANTESELVRLIETAITQKLTPITKQYIPDSASYRITGGRPVPLLGHEEAM